MKSHVTRNVTRAVTALGCVTMLGVVGAGCITRPVTSQQPTTKTNFTAVVRQAAIDKVDLLFAIDNSASMGDKQLLLAQAVPDLLTRLVTPNCVDDKGAAIGDLKAGADGKCSQGKPEFQPVHDMHIGIVSSSLGGRGADICNGTDQVGAGQKRHDDDQGHLLNRASAVTPTYPGLPTTIGDEVSTGHPTPDLEPSNYLSWLPDVTANTGKTDPGAVKGPDPTQLIKDFQEAIGGVHEYGCGIEAQLESWYRFLVQPDPYASIDPVNDAGGQPTKRGLTGVDGDILKQRKDFLRPDSLVSIILLSDEDDSAADPRAVGGQGWAYANSRFPGKTAGPTHMGAARGTSACDNAATVNTADCTSCGFPGHAGDPNCALTGDGQAGYYADAEDTLNTRFVRMRQRYGVDPQFPIKRYVNGLKSLTVPDRNGEQYNGAGTDGKGNNSYNGNNNCRNPLFAQNLPTDTGADLCHLTPGPRTPDLVFFAAITGVPWQLLTEHPDQAGSEGNFLSTIPHDRWKLIVGNDPNNYDFTGIDPHMIQSQDPRPGITAGTNAGDTADPWHGREWDTGKVDLQYACTFPLPAPKDCTDAKYTGACDCSATTGPRPPLCDGTKVTTQIRGKAYPGIRQLTVVRDLGDQGIVSSLCPRTLDQNSQDYGYRPAVRAIVDRLKNALANQCLPQQLTPSSTCNDVPCLILETLPNPGPESDCTKDPRLGLTIPDPVVLAKFREQQRAQQGNVSGGDAGNVVDETTKPVCQVTQLVGGPAPGGCGSDKIKYPNDFGLNASCAGSGEAGWCYATGAAAGTCPQAILFSASGNPQIGAKISLQCIESSSAGGGSTKADGGP